VDASPPPCDPDTEFYAAPITVLRVERVDGCQPLPAGCHSCDCVLASLPVDQCYDQTPQCEVQDDGLVYVNCPGGP
jgi:hypothetical protein